MRWISGLLLTAGGACFGIFVVLISKGLSAPIDSGRAALLGGFIGSAITALATVYITNRQIYSQKVIAEEERLFTARKDVFARATALFMQQFRNRRANIAFHETVEVDTIMSELSMLCSDQLTELIVPLLVALSSDIPPTDVEREEDHNLNLMNLKRVGQKMREELRTGTKIGLNRLS